MSRVPRIRFKGFEEDWEQRKLGEFGKATGGISIESEFDEHGKYKVISIGSYSEESKYTDQGIRVYKTKKTESRILNKNDLVMILNDKTSSGNIIGRVLLVDKDNTYVYNQRTERMEINKSKFLPEYLYQLLNSDNIREKIICASQGNTQIYVNWTVIREFTYKITTDIEEQGKIARFFISLDHLITLHQRKLEKLKIIKKSMLENLFPQNGEKTPKIRFSGFTKDWEQHKWIDVVDISKDMVDPQNGKYDNLPHISPGNIESFTGQLYDNVKCVKDENLISGKFKFSSGDIIYGKINPQLGKYLYATFSGLTSADAYVLNAKNDVIQKYLYTIIQTRNFFEYSVSVSMRSGMPKINRDELNAYSFFAPVTDEQLKIGNCILKYDHLITLHQSKLDKLQKIKKSMLESMFV